jgi:hypothetical protein
MSNFGGRLGQPKKMKLILGDLFFSANIIEQVVDFWFWNRLYNLFQNQKSTNTAFYLENTTDNVADFCF